MLSLNSFDSDLLEIGAQICEKFIGLFTLFNEKTES